MMTDERLTLLMFDHYRLSKPVAFKDMTADGTLWDTIAGKVTACQDHVAVLVAAGMSEIEAESLGIETIIRERG